MLDKDSQDKNIFINRVGPNLWNIRVKDDAPAEGYMQITSTIILALVFMNLCGVTGISWFGVMAIPAFAISLVFRWVAFVASLVALYFVIF